MKFFTADIRQLARENRDFRRVLYTGPNSQLVLMHLERREQIGEEVHDEVDQIFLVVEGHGATTVDGTVVKIKGDDVVFVPRGARHNVTNADPAEPLKLVTVYSPPIHAPGTVHHTKSEAVAEEEAAR